MSELDTLFARAVRDAKAKDYSSARRLLQKILKQDRTYTKAWILYAKLTPPDERQKYIDSALRVDPQNAVALKMQQDLKNEMSKPSKIKRTASTFQDYGAEIERVYRSWSWRFGMAFIFILTMIAVLTTINTPIFQQYWSLVLREGTIFVSTRFLGSRTFLTFLLISFVGLSTLSVLLTSIGHYVAIFEYGIEEKSMFGTKKMRWDEVIKAEYIEGENVLTFFGFKLNSESQFRVAMMNDKQFIIVGKEMQKFPDAGRLIVDKLSDYIRVERVDVLSIKTRFERFAEKLS